MRRPSMLLSISILSIAVGAIPMRRTLAQGAGPNPVLPGPQIVITATGEARLSPDRATVYVGVETRGPSASVAARDNAQRQRAIIDAIVKAGVSRSQIATENYTVAPDSRFDPATRKTTVNGYVVSNVVRVDLQRVDQVSPVLDAALASGANQINSLDFYASNADSARREALGRAVIRARADAEAAATAAGGAIGALLELVTMDGGPQPVFRAMNAAQAGTTPIESGQQRIQVSVTTRWEYLATRK